MGKGVTATNLEKIAIIAGERNVTFAQALQYIDMFAQRIPSSGDNRIIVFSENSEGWIYAFFSIWQQGGVAVPVDASSTVSDLRISCATVLLTASGPRSIMCLS